MSERIDVSVVVPTHNGAGLLPQTLAQIAAQETPPDLSWEVIVVDNGSTDGTAEVARTAWPAESPVDLRVVQEGKLGLTNAHLRGFAEARGELVSWVEDDNRVAPNWVELVWRTMGEHPEAGGCGGFNEPDCEGGAPPWFPRFQAHYACGPQGTPGDITEDRGYVWGAGMTVRSKAWRHLVQEGFRPLLGDRRGRSNYDTGGDSEICLALRLTGWRLRFNPSLTLRHFLQSHRLDWRYLRRLRRGVGTASVGLDPYLRALGDPHVANQSESWATEARRLFAHIRPQRKRLLEMLRRPCEGDEAVLILEADLGRLGAFLRQRREYDRSFDAIAGASWRRDGGPS